MAALPSSAASAATAAVEENDDESSSNDSESGEEDQKDYFWDKSNLKVRTHARRCPEALLLRLHARQPCLSVLPAC